MSRLAIARDADHVCSPPSVVVGYLDLRWTFLRPDETNPIPVVYTNTVFPIPIPGESFEPIAWRSAKVDQDYGRIELVELSPGNPPYR